MRVVNCYIMVSWLMQVLLFARCLQAFQHFGAPVLQLCKEGQVVSQAGKPWDHASMPHNCGCSEQSCQQGLLAAAGALSQCLTNAEAAGEK
jgi:hypothetical protein